MRPFRPRAPRSPLSLWQRLLCLVLLLAPVAYLGYQGANAMIRQIDGVLAQAAPLVSAEASRSLGREVRVGSLRTDLLAGGIVGIARRLFTFGTLPVTVTDVVLANGATVAGSGVLASVPRATIELSIPALLSGQIATGGVPRIDLTTPYLLLIRERDGTFNVAKILPPRPPGQPASPPFRTYVAVRDGRLTFRDYQAFRGAAAGAVPVGPAENYLAGVTGSGDLSGARQIRFAVDAHAQPGTPSVRRLAGALAVNGSMGRGLPGTRTDAPAALTARYIAHIRGGGAAAAYWVPYFVTLPAFRVADGVADADVSISGPRPAGPAGTPPHAAITVSASYRGVKLVANQLPQPLTDTAGTVTYDSDGTVTFDAQGRVIGRPVRGSGTLWDLPSPGVTTVPQLAVRFGAEGVPVQEALRSFLPHTRLPRGLRVSGVGAVTASVNGSVTKPVITASASLSQGGVAYGAYPGLTDLSGNVTYSQGLLGVTNARASVEGGGTVTGRMGYRVLPSGPGSAADQGNAVFSVRAAGVPLARLASLPALAALRSRPLRLAGTGNADVIGKRVGGALSAAANVTTSGLALGGVPFPVASARLVLDRGSVALPAARILSPAGALTVRGGLGQRGVLSLRFAANGVDVGRIARAVGVDRFGGLVSASGTVQGTTAAPRVLVDQAVALNLRYHADAQPARGGAAAVPARDFALDTATVRNAVITPTDVVFEEPLLLRRYPAVAAVSGRVSGLGIAGARPGTPGPRVLLTARVSNLDYAEVMRQLGFEPPLAPGAPAAAHAVAPLVIPTATTAAPKPVAAPGGGAARFSGSVASGTVRVSGPLAAPRVEGAADLGRLLVGPYPIDGGYVRFAYGPEGASLPEVRLRASVGVVTASAALNRRGQISGRFRGAGLNLGPLSFLSSGAVALGGSVSVSGTFSGDVRNPVVTARVAPSAVSVAGTPLTDLRADLIRFRYAAASGGASVGAPELSFSQDGTRVALRNLRYDLKTGRFGADARVDAADAGRLLDSVRRSDFAASPAGAKFVRALDSLPYPVTGHVVLDPVSVSGRFADGALTERSVVASLRASGLRVGEYSAESVAVRGSLTRDLVRLDQMEVISQGTTIRGGGTADLAPGGRINVLVETNQASLDLVRAFPGASAFPVRGHVDATIAAQGLTSRPTVTASLEGRDLVIAPPPPVPTPAEAGRPAIAPKAGVPVPSSAATAEPGPSFALSLVRAAGTLENDARGGVHLVVPDVLVRSGVNEISGEADIPIRLGDPAGLIAPDRPISLRANVARVDLAALLPNALAAAAPQYRGTTASGVVSGSVALGGTLNSPALDGALNLTGGSLRLPVEPGNKHDRINPVSAFDASLRLSGDRIDVDRVRVALGAPSGQKGDFGSVTAAGTVTLTNLSDLQRLFGVGSAPTGRRRPNPTPIRVGGTSDLQVTFDHFSPRLDNATALLGSAAPRGLGEAVRGTVDGVLAVTGPVTGPTIATKGGAPLRLTGAYVQLPSRTSPPAGAATASAFNPSFSIGLDLQKGITITQASAFRLDASGGIQIAGTLALPNVQGTLTTRGGYYNYALARFTVQKEGEILLRYTAGEGLGVTLNDVVAKTKVYAPGGATPTLAARASDPTAGFGSTQPPVSSNANGYRITITIKGPLLLSDQATGQAGPSLTFSSDPYLTQPEIIALIGTSEQIALAARGDLSNAIQLGAQQALYSSVVPRALAPLESSVASAFGLEEFGVEYNPDAPFVLRFVKRLPDPLDRFVVEFTRSFVTRNYSQTFQPYTYRLSYEIFQLRPTRGVRPRLQIGVQSDDQNTVTYFLQGTVNY